MSEVHRYDVVVMLSEAGGRISYDPYGPEVVLSEHFDRVTAERDALRAQVAERDALLLNAWECDIPTPLKRDIRAALSTTAKPEPDHE